jgi:hypothetical protein
MAEAGPMSATTMRADVAMQTAVARDEALANAPTLSRLEMAATPARTLSLHGMAVHPCSCPELR